MKIYYIIFAFVFMSCSCEESTVVGVVVLNNNETLSAPEVVLAKLPAVNSTNGSATEPVAKPKILVQPPILVAKNPVTTNESDSSYPPQVSPTKSSVNDTKTAPLKLIVERLSLISTLKKPADNNTNGSNSSTSKTTERKPAIEPNPRLLFVKKPVDNNTKGSDLSALDDKSNVCAHTMCPMISCQNSLPAIPSQGICCQRCVTNPKCNTTACPKYKCATHVLPANLTAGECCDSCAPVSIKPETTSTITTTKSSAKQEKTTRKPKKCTGKPQMRQSSSSSEEEEEEDNSQNSNSEQDDGRPLGCNIRPFNPKAYQGDSYLIRLLTQALARLRYHHLHEQYYDAFESEEKK